MERCFSILNDFNLSLLDDSECLSGCDHKEWDLWSTHQQALEETAGWVEIRVPLSYLNQTNLGSTGNNRLDLHRLRGFEMIFEISQESAGKILLDHLACIGNEQLIGAALFATSDLHQTIKTEGGWVVDAFASPLALRESNVSMDRQNGQLKIEYLVQHSKDWGGYTALS